jgi:hypothetical protein
MPNLSPLLKSSFEVLEHALYHYFRSDTSIDRKFAALHLDQGIELLLKERVRKSGVSIYRRGGKETISSWESYGVLDEQKCKIPERANLELLHDDRNNIQHRYYNPGPEETVFHMENGVRFLERFLKVEFNIEIRDVLPAEYIAQILGK